jgi:hypothetical protein
MDSSPRLPKPAPKPGLPRLQRERSWDITEILPESERTSIDVGINKSGRGHSVKI